MDIVVLRLDAPAADDVARPGAGSGRTEWTNLGITNLGLAFLDIARAYPDRVAIVTQDRSFSYGWLLSAATAVRRYLRGRPGHLPGERVALQLSNSAEYVAAFYGALLADCVVVPLPVALEGQRRRQIQEVCQPAVLISRPEDFTAKDGDGAVTELPLAAAADEPAVPAPTRPANDLAMLLFTSGSTGMPKGVMLTHGNLLANAASILHELPIRDDDRALVALPFCHAFGNSILQTHMLSGATLVLGGALTFPAAIVDALRERRATSFSAVPEVYSLMLKFGRLGQQALPDLRYMAVAGGAFRDDLATELAGRIAPASFYLMYGQSEATSRLTTLAIGDLRGHRGSIGKPIKGVELAVMDEAGRPLPAGSVGMLCARGANIMAGYWQDPEGTASVLGPDGWLRTGDLARQDGDGHFYLNGRANLLVKIQGHRVHPAEVETVVETHFPHVSAVAVPFLYRGDTRFALFVVARDDAEIDAGRIRAVCQQELPAYKQPVTIELLDRFPLTSAYKVDRGALSRLAVPQPKSAA